MAWHPPDWLRHLVKTKLWGIIGRELRPLAVPTGTPPVWTFDEHEPVIEMFEKYTFMRMSTKVLDSWTSAKERRYLLKNQQESALLSVYKYDNETSTIGQHADFEEQCIGPASADRGGAATEELHQSMMVSLKEKWGATFTAQDMSWRL
ncbi:hypothetical protein GN244_ATG05083 [Phytophthora infestans]|uniref:Uncharacterized protein n=1 Tax=Phytophthora infestans TaxID=4787 RepID=A0A833TLE1_PHYIN|nr:hypothetical protein GN244_ATG05083 [Phytophthora infestans]KAF4127941.1 hypothetical protein GN958_ATG22769 [Phytophthora infestans]